MTGPDVVFLLIGTAVLFGYYRFAVTSIRKARSRIDIRPGPSGRASGGRRVKLLSPEVERQEAPTEVVVWVSRSTEDPLLPGEIEDLGDTEESWSGQQELRQQFTEIVDSNWSENRSGRNSPADSIEATPDVQGEGTA